jgi:hypothetical protein
MLQSTFLTFAQVRTHRHNSQDELDAGGLKVTSANNLLC